MYQHKSIINWKGGMAFEAEQAGGTVKLDGADAVGGKGLGVRPKSLMLTSLGGCTAMDVAYLLKKMRAEVRHFEVEVSANLTDEHPKYFDKVHIQYKFYGKDFKKKKIEKSVNLSVDRYCGVNEMFRRFAEVSFEIEYIED